MNTGCYYSWWFWSIYSLTVRPDAIEILVRVPRTLSKLSSMFRQKRQFFSNVIFEIWWVPECFSAFFVLMSARQVPRRTFRCLWDHHTHHGRHPGVCEQAEDRKPEGLPDQNYQNVYQIFYSQFAIEYYSVTRRYSSVLAGYRNKNKHKYYFSFTNSKSPKNKEHWDLYCVSELKDHPSVF